MCDELHIHDKYMYKTYVTWFVCLCYLLKASQFSYISKNILIVYAKRTQITNN